MEKVDYKKISIEARIKVLEMIYLAQTSHIGSNFSCIDILAVLFERVNLDRDKVILSKGWAAASLYYFLWKKGRITKEELDSYCKTNSKFIGLAEPIIDEIPFASGSMGTGFPAGVGFALSKKIQKEKGRIFVLMGDGEIQCGTTWESALISSFQKLDNLTIIIDCNNLQAMGKVKDVLDIEPLKEKWKAFGFEVKEIDGHNFKEIESTLSFFKKVKPVVIIAKTIKGKGVSFMEGENIYHYKAPSDVEYKKALKELKNV